jgi:DNA ligase (NAD+)
LEKFIAKGFIHEFADLFRLADHRDEIIEMEGLGQRSFENLMEAIEAARRTTRVRLLYSLGIPTIGLANAKVICKFFEYDWLRIQSAAAEDLVQIDGVGEVMAENFVSWFADETNRVKLDHLLAEITFAEESAPAADGSLSGMIFVVTGTLETWENRDALKSTIESMGGKVTGSVSEKTTYLINNDVHSASSKNKKAKTLGVPIISEEDFRAMIGEA